MGADLAGVHLPMLMPVAGAGMIMLHMVVMMAMIVMVMSVMMDVRSLRYDVVANFLVGTKALACVSDNVTQPTMGGLILKPARPNHRGFHCWGRMR